MTRTSTTRRDAGLRTLSSATRWTVAGAVGLTGVFAAVAAHFVPGRASAQAPTATQPSASSAGNGGAATDNGSSYSSTGSSGLQPPSQAPSAVGGSGSVSSGAT